MKETLFLGIKLIDWAWLIGGLVTLTSVIRGLAEYAKNNRIKRADFLERLITEFNDPKMFLAKRLLDDFWIEREGDESISDPELIKIGSKEKKEKEILAGLFKDLLRDHAEKSVTGYGEHQARQSFDDMLDFFTKLDYYLSLKLITKQELGYFLYYFRRCAFKADGAVMFYASVYGFPSLFRLIYVLGINPKNQELFNKKLAFDNDKQKQYYKKLRSNKR